MTNCEMCGTHGDLFLTMIEGTELNLCASCSKFGKIIKRANAQPLQLKTKTKTLHQEEELVESIVEDYSERIKNAREKLGLKQKELAMKISEKESLIHKIESHHIEPSIVLARKLEKFLQVTLVEEVKETKENIAKRKTDTLTLGDLVTLKNRSG
ncbi:TIGR00270 family protein [Candidatus Woesearchaeota archaeon]|nr:TIGR00270 family protein [Candidatus Woesearchaeota archaeon]